MNTPLLPKARVIEGNRPGLRLLISAGIHGDEFEGMEAVRRLLHEVDPHKLRGRLTLIPVVNEPAYQQGKRTAGDGLDLARHCPGRVDGSVTELIANALAQAIQAADCYIDLHSGGAAMTILPLVGYMLHANPRVLDCQRRMARAFNLPLVWGTSPSLEGRSLSVARDAGVPAIYAEYLGTGACDRRGVEQYVEGCLNVMHELGMLECSTPPPNKVELVVEDPSPGSGHLQACHPSPAAGLFCSAVELGQRVQAGETLGYVADCLGDETHAVRAENEGIVICLASLARVEKGSPLAVVLHCQESG